LPELAKSLFLPTSFNNKPKHNMKNLLTITLVLFTFISYGQDTTYYDSNSKKARSLNGASYYEIIQKSPTNKKQVTTRTYYMSGQQKSECFTSKKGTCRKEWYENGQLHRADTTNSDGKYNGLVLTYWENAILKRNDTFENGNFTKGFCYDKNGKEIEHYDYEIMPCFPGGQRAMIQYLSSETRYPLQSAENGIEGTAYVEFVINKEGFATEFKLVNVIDYNLGIEALRVASNMPRWSPGMVDGDPVRVHFTMPVKFTIQ
jgi:TonB family protein